VDKSRRSKISDGQRYGAVAIGVAALFVACGQSPPLVATVSTATDLPDAARKPDGVLLDPPPALPSAVAHADARGVVALREPADVNAVRTFVTTFIAAFVREDLATLQSVLASDATTLDASGRAPRQVILSDWLRRLQQLEYSRLEGVDVVLTQRIQRFDYDELGGPDDPPRPSMMRPGDTLVRAPIEVSRIGPDKFFGDVIVMVLRHDDTRYKIVAYEEIDTK
jgi:hypothetical protein